jgi:hypothetical protein
MHFLLLTKKGEENEEINRSNIHTNKHADDRGMRHNRS